MSLWCQCINDETRHYHLLSVFDQCYSPFMYTFHPSLGKSKISMKSTLIPPDECLIWHWNRPRCYFLFRLGRCQSNWHLYHFQFHHIIEIDHWYGEDECDAWEWWFRCVSFLNVVSLNGTTQLITCYLIRMAFFFTVKAEKKMVERFSK